LNQSDLRTLYEYNYWATARILRASARLTAAQFCAAAEHSHGGLRGTLVHMLDAEYGWRMFCQHNAPSPIIDEAEFPTAAALQARWLEEEQAMRAYLATLDAADLQQPLPDGDGASAGSRLLWHALFHVINHGTQHRSEAAAILTTLGASPGDLDFTRFLGAEE